MSQPISIATPAVEPDEYQPEFPQMEYEVHDMIEKLYQQLPLAIDSLIQSYDALVAELRLENAALKEQLTTKSE